MRLSEPASPDARYVVKRFILKLAILIVFAAPQMAAPRGLRNAFLALAIFSAAICCGFALQRRETFTLKRLNYWDEAIAFAAIAIIADWVA